MGRGEEIVKREEPVVRDHDNLMMERVFRMRHTEGAL